MKNLIVVAHPDDEVLGFGGAGYSCVKAGEIVKALILCGSADARSQHPSNQQLLHDTNKANSLLGFEGPILGDFPNICMNTVKHLDMVQFIEAEIQDFKPDRIFTHHPADLNDDHKQVANACMAASRLFQRQQSEEILKSLFFMEILSSTDWAFTAGSPLFMPNVFVDITNSIEKKLEALSCYRNVMRPAPHPRSLNVLKGHSSYRGGQCGCLYAESFQLTYSLGL